MQTYTIPYQPIEHSLFPIPANCDGIGVNNGLLWFYFPYDDMTQQNKDDIDAAILLHKHGLCTIVPSLAVDTYTITIETSQPSATPTLDNVALDLMMAVDGKIVFDVQIIVSFTIGADLDMLEVTQNVD